MEDQLVQLLSEIALLCDDADPVRQSVQQCLYRRDGAELQKQLRRLDSLLDQLQAYENQLLSLLGGTEGKVRVQTAWADYLSRQSFPRQQELRELWGKVRTRLSLLHSWLTGLQVTVELRRQLLHNFVTSMQRVDESVNYSASGQVQEQAGSGAMLNRQV